MPPGDLASQLQAVLEDRLGDDVGQVTDLTRLSGGASRQTWAFDLVRGPHRRHLVLQRERPGGLTRRGGMVTEARLMVAAAEAGVPAPHVVCSGERPARGMEGGSAGGPDGVDDRPDVGAAFIVAERVPGETIARKLLRDEEFAVARGRLARQAGEALARIHSIDAAPFAGELDDLDQVAQFREVLDAFDEPHPAFELGFRWLDRHRPPRGREGIVHGDFRTGNLVVGPDGLDAVLDWELAHLGDPIEDLGWFCVRAWRFGSPHRAGGFGSVDELLDGYRSVSGVEVDPEAVRWWEALGTLKWGVMCMVQAGAHLGGTSRSVELAAIGRRTCENEHDLLELIR